MGSGGGKNTSGRPTLTTWDGDKEKNIIKTNDRVALCIGSC